MRRYLVVANRTLGGEHLLDVVRQCMQNDDCSFHIVVPASHPKDAWTEGQVEAAAHERLADALARFRELGAQVDGEVGDGSPVRAIGDVLLREQIDEIILSTLPPGPSRWLRQDVIHRVERNYDVPVTHIVAAEARVPG
jgi:nucleotide-binding universal stress UspA family protein